MPVPYSVGAPWDQLDLASPAQVVALFNAATAAGLSAACRRGCVDVVTNRAPLVASGDLHDNPFHLAQLVEAAGLDGPTPSCHLTLHELIHGDNLHNGMDLSYRVLARAAALKRAHPEHVHLLLANHELSQIAGRGVMKGGVDCVKAFNAGVEYVFGEEAASVTEAITAFIRSMQLAATFEGIDGRVWCSHSLPAPEKLEAFDFTVFSRALTEDDYQPRTGAAHLLTWGRGHTPEQVAALGDQLGVRLFVLGHDFAETGVKSLGPRCVVLNSDHDAGRYLRLDLTGAIPGNLERATSPFEP